MDFNSFNDEFIKMPIILTEELDLFISELNILFSIEKGSILGNRLFGQSIEHLLWKTSYNEEFIKADISRQIEENCLMHEFFSFEVSFTVAQGVSRDIGQLEIIVKQSSDDSAILAAPQWIFK